MAMQIGTEGSAGEADVMIEMNATPLIDVMLVLLIMLIVTIPVQNHAVNLQMPVDIPPPQTVPPEVITIDIDSDGGVRWNGVALADRPTLEARLQAVTTMPNQPEIHLRPNKMAPYKAVAAVMVSAQRLGVTKLGLIGNEQFVSSQELPQDHLDQKNTFAASAQNVEKPVLL